MALALTEEHLALAESVRGWAGRAVPGEVGRAAVAAEDGGAAQYAASLRAGLAGQGLLGLHLPEQLGGQGFGLPELAVAAEELGRALLPGGFLPTVLASAVLARAGGDGLPGLVKDLAAGTLTGAVGLAAGIGADGEGQPGEPGALVIDGSCGPVLGAGLAGLLILPVARGQERTLGGGGCRRPGDHLGGQPGPGPPGRPGAGHPAGRAVRPGPARPAAGAGRVAGGGPVRGRGVRHRGLGGGHRRRLRQDPPSVRPADRPVPGGQAPLRLDAHRRRAGRRRGRGRRHARWPDPGFRRRPPNSPPRWPRWSRSTRPSAARTSASRFSVASATPGSTTPTCTTAGRCRCGRCWASPGSGPSR